MRRLIPSSLVVCTGLACTAGRSGPELWAEACARSLALAPDDSAEAQAECEASMTTHPLAVADDMARCILKAPDTTSQEVERAAFLACINTRTQAYLDAREAAWAQLDALSQALDAREGELPASLAELQGIETKGPWGHPLHYQPLESGYELCVIGPDGAANTADDSCHEPAFIYFQF